MVVRPAQEGKRDAFVRMLATEHGQFILRACLAEGGINEESTKDVCQRVLVTAGKQFDTHEHDEGWPPKNLRGWLTKLVRNETSNYRRLWKPKAREGADAEDASASAPDPEGMAEIAERKARLARYLETLPKEEAEVILCNEIYGMTIEQTAQALQRPWGTVASKLARAKDRLRERAQESDRATLAGERRR
jgi:RNA polymerase sigma-70 factor (ECF subfamily)